MTPCKALCTRAVLYEQMNNRLQSNLLYCGATARPVVCSLNSELHLLLLLHGIKFPEGEELNTRNRPGTEYPAGHLISLKTVLKIWAQDPLPFNCLSDIWWW